MGLLPIMTDGRTFLDAVAEGFKDCLPRWFAISQDAADHLGLVAGDPDADLVPGYTAVLLPVIPALNVFIPDLIVRLIKLQLTCASVKDFFIYLKNCLPYGGADKKLLSCYLKNIIPPAHLTTPACPGTL